MKKVLITGANSYIGTSFEKWVNENNKDIITDTLDMIGGEWRKFDFCGYDTVFHVAGIAHRKETKENADLYYQVNRDLAIETAKRAKTAGVKQFVILSSMNVYGLRCGRITKDTKEEPTTNYGKAKYQADVEIMRLNAEDFKVCIVRPPMVYGKDCKGNYQPLRRLAIKSPFFPNVVNQRSMIYIKNLSIFIEKLILEEKEGLFFPQNAEYVNTFDLVKKISLAHNKNLFKLPMVGCVIRVFLKAKIGVFEKVFGSLIYEKVDLCNDIDFDTSIRETEK